MAEQPADRLAAARRLDSVTKTSQVLAALDAALGAGQPLSIAALARYAGVSRRFIYDHPELRAQAERRAAEAADRRAGTSAASARVTLASLRADLANAKAANHRLNTELAGLRRRLGQLLGHDVLADLDHAAPDASATTGQLAELEQALFQAQEDLAQRSEELDAARQINRELIAKLNRQRP
jgi:chromosome segregation ATPase